MTTLRTLLLMLALSHATGCTGLYLYETAGDTSCSSEDETCDSE